MRPHRTFSCLLALLLAVGQISVTTCQPDPYEEYDADEDSYGAGGMFGGDSPDTPGPGPPLQQHIHGIVDVDALTFDKVVIAPDRPAFVLFYDVDQKPEDQVGVSWILGKVAERMSDHMRLLLVKIDASAASARALKQRFGITTLPTHVLLEGADKQTLYVMDHKDADAAGKLEGWLLEQVGLSAAIDSLLHTVDTFLKDRGSQAATLESAQAQVQQLQPFEARVGKWYLKVMNNVKKKGVGYLQAEKKRLSKMLSESVNDMSEEKAAEFRLRQSVVDVFLSRQQPA